MAEQTGRAGRHRGMPLAVAALLHSPVQQQLQQQQHGTHAAAPDASRLASTA